MTLVFGTYKLFVNDKDIGSTSGGGTIGWRDNKWFFETRIRDLTLENIANIFNIEYKPESSSLTSNGIGNRTTYSSGSSKDRTAPTNVSFKAETSGPNCKIRTLTIPNAEIITPCQYTIKHAEVCEIHVIFEGVGELRDHDYEK